ncbi:MAG: LptF/LptG family permease [Planctomycetia bacterium]
MPPPILRVQRALLVELAVTAVLAVGILTALLFTGFSIQLLSRAGGTLGSGLLWELVPSLLPPALGYSLPFGWLAAVSFTVGRWVNDHEMTSLRAAGVHVRTIAVPVIAVSVLLGVVGMALSAWVTPHAQRDVREGTRDHVERFLSSLSGADRSVLLGSVRLSFDHYGEGVFHGVELDRRDPRTGRLETKVLAERLALSQFHREGEGSSLGLDLEQGCLVQVGEGGEAEVVGATGQDLRLAQVQQLGGSTPFLDFLQLDRFTARARDMDVRDLLYVLERGPVVRTTVVEAEMSLHGRLALGCAPLPMGLFALAMALLLPPSGRRVRDFVLSFLPATLVYFPLLLASTGLAAALPTPTWVAMWLPVTVLGSLSLALLAWAWRR